MLTICQCTNSYVLQMVVKKQDIKVLVLMKKVNYMCTVYVLFLNISTYLANIFQPPHATLPAVLVNIKKYSLVQS